MTDASLIAPDALTEDHEHDPHATNTGISNTKLAMWIFLASDCLLFGALISTFLIYKDPRLAANEGETPLTNFFDIPFTSVSSFILLMSSLTMVLAVATIARGDHRQTRIWIGATAVLGATFIAGQIYEFTAFYREGLGYTTTLSGSAFYTLTGFHGIHVTAGIVMLVTALVLSMRGRLKTEHAEALETIGLYWHFVDIVWVLIFAVVYLIPTASAGG